MSAPNRDGLLDGLRRTGWELTVIALFHVWFFFCAPPESCSIQIPVDSSQLEDWHWVVSWEPFNPLSFLEALEQEL